MSEQDARRERVPGWWDDAAQRQQDGGHRGGHSGPPDSAEGAHDGPHGGPHEGAGSGAALGWRGAGADLPADQPGRAAEPPPDGPLRHGADLAAREAGPGGSLGGHDPSRRRRGAAAVALLTGALLVGLLGGVAGGWLADRGPGLSRVVGAPSFTAPQAGAPQRAPDSVAGIAAQVLPSVVSIEADTSSGRGTGSGFVIDAGGLVLTNNHVVAAAAGDGDIVVVLADGSQEPAEVVGRTTSYDLALLRVDRDGLPALPFGDSDAVVVGDTVIAVGAPLGLESTVTTGIVSATNRPVAAGGGQDAAFINAIQTDAAINPGNSGGPLVDTAGRVIGVNSAIAQAPGSGQTGSIGLGFAIPSNQAARTAEQLVGEGEATYPVIGVLLDRRYTGEGVKVVEQGTAGQPAVTPGGPADRAGVRAGDVITAFEGRPVTEPDELIVAIRARAPGDSVTLTVRRGGDDVPVELRLDEAVSD